MELSNYTTSQLIQMLANATVTNHVCGGHTKAEMNRQRCEEIKDKLAIRKAEIPTVDQLLTAGIFNGKGSC